MTEYAFEVERWIDGDTVQGLQLSTDLMTYTRGKRTITHTIVESEIVRYRLVIVDTPERGEPGYKEATAYCNEVLPPGTWCQAITYEESGGFDRILADLLIPGQGTTTISSLLLRDGLAKQWVRARSLRLQ